MLGNKLDGLPSIRGFGHYFEIGLLFEEQPQTGTNDGVIVSQDNADLRHDLFYEPKPI
jgi:hypothetical protein